MVRQRLFVSVAVSLALLLPAGFVSGQEPLFRRGDSNASGEVDIADPIALLGCLFLFLAEPADAAQTPTTRTTTATWT